VRETNRMRRSLHAATSVRRLACSMRFVSLTASYEELVAGRPEILTH
jgi:hypothetical protein